MPLESWLIPLAVLLVVSVFASRASEFLGVPALLLFLGIGMLAGSDGPGGIEFEDAELAQSLGVLALVLILFVGGLETRWSTVKPVLAMGATLSSAGVLVTALATGLFAYLALGFPLLTAMLLGAIVSSTDAAAVFSVLRSRSVSLKGRLKPLLELESGSNDPMAVFLTVGITAMIVSAQASWAPLLLDFFLQMTMGGLVGYAMGKTTVYAINRARLGYEGLYPVLSLGLVVLTYGLTNLVGGNGFLAVYVAGITMGNASFVYKASLLRHHDGLAWLMQITMFLALGLLVFPSQLVDVAGTGILVSLFLVFVARPVSVFLTLAPFRLSFRERLLVSWVGLRGAVPIILATFPLLAGVPAANTLFNIVFFVVITSVLLQGPTINLLARWLRLDAPLAERQASLLDGSEQGFHGYLRDVRIPPHSPAAGKRVIDLGLPEHTLLVLLAREGAYLVPRGITVIQPGDRLIYVADPEQRDAVEAILAPRPERIA